MQFTEIHSPRSTGLLVEMLNQSNEKMATDISSVCLTMSLLQSLLWQHQIQHGDLSNVPSSLFTVIRQLLQ